METKQCTGNCPRCGSNLALTTEWGWIDADTCTAVLCCPECRTDCGWADAAVTICHEPNEEDAKNGVSVAALVSQMRRQRETFDGAREEEEEWDEDDQAMEKCSCGHTVPVLEVMSTSSGTSCPDCYDRMSE